jgi:hypothetical protein
MKEMTFKEEENERIKHKCKQHEQQIDELMLSRKSDSTVILELDQLK